MASADAVVLKVDPYGETESFPRAGLSRVEVSKGRKGHTLAGAGIGLLAGASIGALYGIAECQGSPSCTGGSDGDMTILESLAWAGIGGGIGLVVGGVIGALYKTERWEDASVDGISISAGTRRSGGVALAISAHF